MELFNVVEKTEGVIAQLKQESKEEGKRIIVSRLLDKYSLSAVAVLLDMEGREVLRIVRD